MNRILRQIGLLLLVTTALSAETLSLEACIDRALAYNIQVLSAEESIVRSRADVASAGARRLPSLGTTLFNFSRSRTGPSLRTQENPTGDVDPVTGERIFVEEKTRIPAFDRSSYSFSAGASHTFYDGGAQRRAQDGARESLAASEFGLRSSRANVVFQVKLGYYSLLKAQELVEVRSHVLKLSQRRQEEAEARLAVGASTRVDVLRLQVAAEGARVDLINAEQQVVLARATLNYAMRRELFAPLKTVPLAGTDSRLEPPTTPQALRQAIAELATQAKRANPSVAQQQRMVMAAEMNLKSTQAAWRPTVSGNLSYGRDNEVFDRVYGGLTDNYRLNGGVSLSYSVFDGGLRSANVRRAHSSVESARLSLEQRQRDLELSVETGYLELVRLGRILEIARRTVELAEEDLRLAEERYRVGKGRLLEVLDAQVGLTGARNNSVTTRYDLAIAEADLERLAGKGAK